MSYKQILNPIGRKSIEFLRRLVDYFVVEAVEVGVHGSQIGWAVHLQNYLARNVCSMLQFIVKDLCLPYKKNEAMAVAAAAKIIRSIIEMIKPVIAKPLGLLNMPMKESRNPRNQTTQLTPGSHDKIIAIRAKMNPVVPIPFDRLTGCG